MIFSYMIMYYFYCQILLHPTHRTCILWEGNRTLEEKGLWSLLHYEPCLSCCESQKDKNNAYKLFNHFLHFHSQVEKPTHGKDELFSSDPIT